MWHAEAFWRNLLGGKFCMYMKGVNFWLWDIEEIAWDWIGMDLIWNKGHKGYGCYSSNIFRTIP